MSRPFAALGDKCSQGGAVISADLASSIQGKYMARLAVFKDRPGVDSMLYLSKVLTAKQMPEARAPVMGKEGKGYDMQTGALLVSVTTEPFCVKYPEHVKSTNAVEIRLVDQDLLSRFADL